MAWPLPEEERVKLAALRPPWTPRFVFLLAVDVQFGSEAANLSSASRRWLTLPRSAVTGVR